MVRTSNILFLQKIKIFYLFFGVNFKSNMFNFTLVNTFKLSNSQYNYNKNNQYNKNLEINIQIESINNENEV